MCDAKSMVKSTKRIGVVADDITGANDIGVMLAKNGLYTGVFSLHTAPEVKEFEGLDAVIINTDSRLDDAQSAWEKTERACKLLQALPCDVYHSKTCSVFRGNIGAQFDAMQRCLGVRCSMVVLGFPRNGRTTVHGTHYVYGTPLAESMFRNDPMHPMTESDLVRILSTQSRGRVRLFDVTQLDLSEAERVQSLARMKETCEYVLFDVRDQHDLSTIAALIAQEPSICGSSAICEELPKVWSNGRKAADSTRNLLLPIEDSTGVLIVSGSLTEQTKAQVRHLIESGMHACMLPTWALFDAKRRAQIVHEFALELAGILQTGKSALVYGALLPEDVARTMKAGSELRMRPAEVGRLVSAVLGEISAKIVQQIDARKIVVAGGETSAAISDALRIRKMIILHEIEAGVPAMVGVDVLAKERLLVFKSGSFGSNKFLADSEGFLRQLQNGIA